MTRAGAIDDTMKGTATSRRDSTTRPISTGSAAIRKRHKQWDDELSATQFGGMVRALFEFLHSAICVISRRET
jgi:hypothetical protein